MLPILFAEPTAAIVAEHHAPTPPPTVDDILAMAEKLPVIECPGPCPKVRRGAFGHVKDARIIAQAIADGIQDDEHPWLWAARGVTYAAYESGMRACPKPGDGGKAWGGWQLQGVPPFVACIPERAFPIWLRLAKASEADCAKLPRENQLAELASGSCARGRDLAARRDRLARSIVP